MSTLSTRVFYLSYDSTRRRDGNTDQYDETYTLLLNEAYADARRKHPTRKDAHEFTPFTCREPTFDNSGDARWVVLPNFYGARVCFFYDEVWECVRGIQRTQSGMRHVYRIEVDLDATTFYHPVLKQYVPVPATEARIVRWAWYSVPVDADANVLDTLRRRGATDEDPGWVVFPKDVDDALEAAYTSSCDAPTVDVMLGNQLHIELGTDALQRIRELGTFQCRNGNGNNFVVKRLRQTESHVVMCKQRLQQQFKDIQSKQQAAGKNTDPDCCICMESISSSPFYLLPCEHLGHTLCLQGCAEGHGGTMIRCPMCREVGAPKA